jgi:Sulfite exporter TauE/SafE
MSRAAEAKLPRQLCRHEPRSFDWSWSFLSVRPERAQPHQQTNFRDGAGFLIVPGLIGATGMPLVDAIGSSLVAVSAFGMTTAVSYAGSGLVDRPLAVLCVLGGALGGIVGLKLARLLAARKHALTRVFQRL